MAKAKSLCETLKGKAEPGQDVEFIASSGCFKYFRSCYSLHNVKWVVSVGDGTPEGEFLETLEKLIVEENKQNFNMDEHIFNMDETSPFWKGCLKGLP